MEKLRLSIVLASVAITLAAVSPAGAITYGVMSKVVGRPLMDRAE